MTVILLLKKKTGEFNNLIWIRRKGEKNNGMEDK